MRRPIKRRINKSIAYNKETMVGIIIFVNESENWCNVELMNGDVLYQIPFRSSNIRLRRVEQPVTLTEVHGMHQKYVITGASNVRISSSTFEPKGTTNWDSGNNWNDRWVWA